MMEYSTDGTGPFARITLEDEYPMIKTWTEHTLEELEAMPTLIQGQADDCKEEVTFNDGSTRRLWLSRCTVEDGEPCDNKVTVEWLENGRWIGDETIWEAVTTDRNGAYLKWII